MIFQPVVSLALVIALILALLIFVVWQFVRSTSQQEKVSWVRRGLLVVLVGIMAVGPSTPGGKSPAGMLNLDVIFVVDTTTSMGAEDYDGDSTRMEGVRADIQNIAKNMTGARFSIITFDDEARVMLPMTTDQSSLSIVASQLVRESSIRSQGSSIDAALNATTQQLVANKKQNPQRPSVLFYLGDGEQTTKESPKSFAGLATYIQGGAVLGYGTAAGGKMKSYYGYGDETKCINNSFSSCYVVDNSTFNSISNNTPALSKIDENNLKKIAGEMRIPYENRNNGGDTQSLFDASKIDTLANSSREVTLYTNLYFIFAIPFIVLLLWELLYVIGKYRELSSAKPRSKS